MTKSEQRRLVAWRLKILMHARDVSENVSRTCRHFGISRPTFYKWKTRFEEDGEARLCDRSRAPLKSPNAKSSEVVSKITYTIVE